MIGHRHTQTYTDIFLSKTILSVLVCVRLWLFWPVTDSDLRIPTSLRGVGPYGPYGPEAAFF